MNEILLDQIPNLIDLQKFIEQLAVVDPPIAKKDLVLEQVKDKFKIIQAYNTLFCLDCK